MGIFRRRSKPATTGPDAAGPDTAGPDTADPDTAGPDTADPDTAGPADELDSAEIGTDDDVGAQRGASVRVDARADGPFDRSEVDGLEGRLDLGSLWLAGLPGMELRIEVEQESQNLVAVTAVLGESALQLQAFAAPRTAGIWDEICTEIAASITSQGGTADIVDGPLGAELQARMPGQGADGRTVFSPARFVGVDGPRWFLRGVLSGRAAIDPDSAGPLLEVLRATVVVRGEDAMAPRDLLPLRLPDQPDQLDANGQPAQGATGVNGVADDGAGAPSSVDDLKPFERGPEITEIR